jgi:23S rRNA (adenine2030-N6)-methyltransferase
VLSYRHSFHAGNFADVLKHIVLVEILLYLRQKEAAFHYIDTHAGAGLFDLESEHAQKLGEHRTGIASLSREDWPDLSAYFDAVMSFNPDGALKNYPGSPMLARRLMREQDRSWLFELHPADYTQLQAITGHDRRIKVMQEDGLKGMLRLVPPVSRRALVLVDPSYEVKTEFEAVVDAISAAHRKFPTGIYAAWYPVVNRQRIDSLIQRFASSGMRNIQRFELARAADTPMDQTVAGKKAARGMTASGMIVVNPPWVLMEKMSHLLPRLLEALGGLAGGFYRAETLVGE